MEKKIALIADVHLTRSQYGRVVRGEQIFHSLRRAISNLNAFGITDIICAGDLLDNNNPGPDVIINYLGRIHRLLKKNGMRMWCTKGNHDNAEQSWWWAYENEDSDYGIKSLTEDTDIGGIKVRGLDFGRNVIQQAFEAKDFKEVDLLACHGEISELTGYPSDDSIPVEGFFNEEEFKVGNWPSCIVVGHIHIANNWIFETDDKCRMGLVSPGSTDFTVYPGKIRDETGKVPVAVFDVEEGKKAVFKEFEFVEYSRTFADSFVIKTEAELDEACEAIATDHDLWASTGAVYYIHYATSVKDIIPKLQRMLDNKNYNSLVTLVTKQVIEDEQLKTLENVQSARAIKTSPAQYFLDHTDTFLPQTAGNDLKELCLKILTPGLDAKADLDTYVEKQIGGTVL